MSETPEFISFPKISRLNRRVIVTEKLDGTNAQVYVTDDNELYVGSRNRWLGPGQDNMGFYAWAMAHKEELLQLGPGRHFGEWWGKGIQKHTGIDHKRFSLFNISRWRDVHGTNDGIADMFDKQSEAPACCHVVPVLAVLQDFDTDVIKEVVQLLREQGSVAAPGYMKPEGVIIYHEHSGYLFKVTLENDTLPKNLAAIDQAVQQQTAKDSL